MLKVSVIIPTHNRAELLKSAILSVLSQTFQDFEIVVVDDASQDHTPEVVNSFGDERIRYIRHQVNKGEGGARNTGVVNAQGEFIAFLDDDDEWLPEKLELQVKLLDRSAPKVGGVYTGFSKIDKASGKLLGQTVPTKRGDILNDILTKNSIASCTILLRKECFDKVGLFEEEMTYGADYDLWIRVARDFHFQCIEKILAIYYIHGNNVTNNCETIIRGIETQLKRYASLWASNRKGCSERYFSLGVLYCYTADTKKGRSALLSAIRLHPFQIRYYYYLALSLMGADYFRKITDARERLISNIQGRFSAQVFNRGTLR